MGYISSQNTADSVELKKGVIYGSVLASFTVEDFSVKRLVLLQKEEMNTRFGAFLKLSNLE
jgi:hypothetical protein